MNSSRLYSNQVLIKVVLTASVYYSETWECRVIKKIYSLSRYHVSSLFMNRKISYYNQNAF